jgi:large subunit ribosomal protein L10
METKHVADKKKKIVSDLVKLMNEYDTIGVVNMDGLPAAQLQKMRRKLRGKVAMYMAKKRLINLAIDQIKKPGFSEIKKYVEGMPNLIFTNDNPFVIAKSINKSKSSAPAKPGQIAPKDITVPAGPTPFAPGPVISELGQAGIKAGIEAGKVIIKADSLVAKKGEKIKANVSSILLRLGIQPMEIGLNLVAVYEKGLIFTNDILSVDEQQYIDNITTAAKWAMNLSVEAGYITKDNIEVMIAKAANDSKALAAAQSIEG